MKNKSNWPESFKFVDRSTTDELHPSEIQRMVDQAEASAVPFMIIEAGDTLVIKAEDTIIVTRTYFTTKKKTAGQDQPTVKAIGGMN